MALDIATLRAETPGVEHVIHLNNAGASLPPQQVIDAQVGWIQDEARVGGYEIYNDRSDQIEAVYDAAAKMIGADRDEIALLEHATLAWWQAFHSIPMGAGQRVLTSEVDYGANLVAYTRATERTGVAIEVVPSDATGQIDLAELEARIDSDVAVVAVTHMPTNGGLVNPAAAIGAITRVAGVPFLLDACQTAGQMPLDVDAIGCDFLSTTGRKYLRGPRGTGFLYARASTRDWATPLLLDFAGAPLQSPSSYELLPTARRYEMWESSYSSKAGLGAAIDLVNRIGIDDIWTRVQQLADNLRNQLTEIGATVYDLGSTRGGICTFTLPGRVASDVRAELRTQAINVSVSTNDGALIDATKRDLPDLIRASVHYFNTDDDIGALIEALGVAQPVAESH